MHKMSLLQLLASFEVQPEHQMKAELSEPGGSNSKTYPVHEYFQGKNEGSVAIPHLFREENVGFAQQ